MSYFIESVSELKATFFKKAISPLEYLFWKTQINILRACPPLFGIVSSTSLGSANSPRIWVKTAFRLAWQTPYALLLHWRDKRENRIVLSRCSVLITTRCTLNCNKCAAHIPDLTNRKNLPLNALVQDLQLLFSYIDHIYDLNLIGGETFLHQDLDELIQLCAKSGKAGHITVTTNGTVIPNVKTLAALKTAGVTVKISNFGPALQPKVAQLKAVLEENGIHHTHESATFWYDTGTFGQRQEGSIKRRFSICSQQLCLPYFNGKLHLCAESVFLMEEGRIPDCREDYIDLQATSPAAFRTQWRKLLKKRSVSACSYCLGFTYKSPKIPVAVQRES